MNKYNASKKYLTGALVSILILSSGFLFRNCLDSSEIKFKKITEEKRTSLFSEDYNLSNIENYFFQE
jgi:hypothetical protein